jgi:hypothetical protein
MNLNEKLNLVSLLIHRPLIHQNSMNPCEYKSSFLECKKNTICTNMLYMLELSIYNLNPKLLVLSNFGHLV